ncbi:NAD-P-binding protein [Trametes meyenii]|nr:NAD-P-binding protein [Trametes meyenii]
MVTTTKVSIFITGATGYIGGSILQRLLWHPNFEITALVRNADKAKQLETQFSVKSVVGSLQDLDKLASAAESSHLVIHMASSDDVEAINAILRGLKARHDKTGDLPLLIHTSGLGVIADEARGAYASDKVYSDLDLATIEALPPTALHRPVDLLVVAADEAGYARTHIVLPSAVLGSASGPLYDAGISNPHTIVMPVFVRVALARGAVGVMGTAASVWGGVHVDDAADFYTNLLDTLLSTPEKVSHGRAGYFFLENGEFIMRELMSAIADPLFDAGRVPTRELVPFTQEELPKVFGAEVVCVAVFSNARSKAERARKELGWAPKYVPKDLLDSVKHEVEILLKKEDAKK